jgi:outer membrane receptor protein involved in Fe transport
MAADLEEVFKRDPVDLVNARFGLVSGDSIWQVTLWGRNLLDEEYHVVVFDVPVAGGFAGVNAPPLTFGLALNYQTAP